MDTTDPAVRRFDLSAAIKAGLLGGLIFLLLEMMLVAVALGGSPWGPPRMIAAIGMGKAVLPPPATFDAGVMAVAMVIHFALSAIYGIIVGMFVRGRSSGTAAMIGAVFGFVVYLANFYAFTAIFPWFAMGRTWVSIVSHIVFGLVTAAAYIALASRMDRGPIAAPVR